jgi:hypothetical protein
MGPCPNEPTADRIIRIEFDWQTFEIVLAANPLVPDAHLVDEARHRVRERYDPRGRFRSGEVLQ